jgi:hypothetical protein
MKKRVKNRQPEQPVLGNVTSTAHYLQRYQPTQPDQKSQNYGRFCYFFTSPAHMYDLLTTHA